MSRKAVKDRIEILKEKLVTEDQYRIRLQHDLGWIKAYSTLSPEVKTRQGNVILDLVSGSQRISNLFEELILELEDGEKNEQKRERT